MTITVAVFLFLIIFSTIVIYENSTYATRLRKVENNIRKNKIGEAFKILNTIFIREEYKYKIYLSYYYIYNIREKWHTAYYYLDLILDSPSIYKHLNKPEKLHYKKAILLESLKDYEMALKEYSLIEKKNPKFIKSLEKYGALLYRLNNYNDALEKLEKAYEIGKNKKLIGVLIELCFLNREYRKCLIYADQLDENLEKNYENEKIVYYCAGACYFLRKYSEALKSLKILKLSKSRNVSEETNTNNLDHSNDLINKRHLLENLIDYKLNSEDEEEGTDPEKNANYLKLFKEALDTPNIYEKNILLEARYYYAEILFSEKRIEEGYVQLEEIRKVASTYKSVVKRLQIYKEIFGEHILQEMFLSKEQIYVMNEYIYPLFKEIAVKNFLGAVLEEKLIVVEFSKNHGISKMLQTVCCFYSGHEPFPLFFLRSLLRKYFNCIFYLYSPFGVSHETMKRIKATNTDIRMIKHNEMKKFIAGQNIFHVEIKADKENNENKKKRKVSF